MDDGDEIPLRSDDDWQCSKAEESGVEESDGSWDEAGTGEGLSTEAGREEGSDGGKQGWRAEVGAAWTRRCWKWNGLKASSSGVVSKKLRQPLLDDEDAPIEEPLLRC